MKKYFVLFALAALTLAGCKEDDPTVKVESVSINKETLTLMIGDKQTLTANVLPANAENKKVSWASSAAAVATVDATSGEVTAVGKGEATITVTTEDGKKTDTCVVTVSEEPVAGEVTVAGNGFDIDEVQTIKLSESEGARVQIDIAATKGIDKMLVEITSSSEIFSGALAGMGLGGEFDLANPTPEQAASFASLEGLLPYGDDVKGKTELVFDISTFIPLIFMVAGECTADFKVTVSDADNVNDSKTLKLNLIDDTSTVAITGEGFNIDQVKTILLSESATTEVKVNVASSLGIDKFLVEITSSSQDFMNTLAGMGLTGEFDLANPSDVVAGTLMGILPSGEDVKGETQLELDMSMFIGMIFALAGECTVDIKMTVSDAANVSDSKTLKLSLIDDTPGEVSIVGQGFDIYEEQTVYTSNIMNTAMKMNVSSVRGIDKFLVGINSSSPEITGTLTAVGLGGSFDLANPTPEVIGALGMLEGAALPYGDAVKGKQSLVFDISGFIPVLYELAGADCSITFDLTVSDDQDVSDNKTLTINITTPPQLPNAGFEEWYETKNSFSGAHNNWFPYASDADAFWATGNTILGGDVTSPTEDTHSGSMGVKSALLASKSAPLVGMAAGNIFTGRYVRTITSLTNPGGVVEFGRPFTGRPSAMVVWYKAAPGVINAWKEGAPVANGTPDQYQIYIALADSGFPHEVNTTDKSTFIDYATHPGIIAYGELVGSDPVDVWTKATIELEYRSTDRVPTHIIVVAGASMYGDYFTGSTTSKLWVDDFELVY
jgi:hypothetical protein